MYARWILYSSVTSSPKQVQAAIEACKEALYSLKGSTGITSDTIQCPKRTILNRFKTDTSANKFWVEVMSGTQLECIPQKTIKCIADFETILSKVALSDVQLLVDALKFDENSMTSCIGITSPQPPNL